MFKPSIFLAALAWSGPLRAQSVDTSESGALIAEAVERSEVIENLRYLSDVIGPRLSGSPGMRRANQWPAERFRAYGLSAALEPVDFGVAWERGSLVLRIVEPFDRAITGHSWSWTAGTDGKTRKGPVVVADLSTRDSFALHRNRVRGAWVLPKPSSPVWNPDGPPPTPQDSERVVAILTASGALTADTSAAAVLERRQFQIDLPYMVEDAGALGTLVDGGKEHALMTMSGSPDTDHLAFAVYGIPSFNFDQDPRGYFHTHHSESDTFDKAVGDDLAQASAVMAVTAYELANLPALLPRRAKPGPERIPNRPSEAVAGGR